MVEGNSVTGSIPAFSVQSGGERGVNEQTKELEGVKVLVIDDSKTIRRTAETLLSRAGATVFTAIDGYEALSLITDSQPDVIFADVMMPRLDGYQTCTLLKNTTAYRETPVIMLSSKDGLFDIARGRVVGSEEYVTKPFTRDELIGAVKRHVGERRHNSE